MKCPIEQEIEESKKYVLFDIIEFNRNNRLEVIFGEDCQYHCYINKKCYAVEMTAVYAMIRAIQKFSELNPTPNHPNQPPNSGKDVQTE